MHWSGTPPNRTTSPIGTIESATTKARLKHFAIWEHRTGSSDLRYGSSGDDGHALPDEVIERSPHSGRAICDGRRLQHVCLRGRRCYHDAFALCALAPAAAKIASTFSGAKNSLGDIVPAFRRAKPSMAAWLP